MNIPGFTAEASLYNGDDRYRATAEAQFHGGHVQPAFPFSDRIDPNRPVLGVGRRFGSDVFDPYRCHWRYLCTWEEVWYDPVRKKPLFLKNCSWLCT